MWNEASEGDANASLSPFCHVMLSDCELGNDYVLAETETPGELAFALLPAFPQGAVSSRPELVVLCRDCKSEDAATRLLKETTFQGVIVNDLEGIDDSAASLLEQGYSGIDVGSVRLLELGRRPPGGTAGLYTLLVGGVVLVLAGGFVGFRAFREFRA